jgi:hypothetical protein
LQCAVIGSTVNAAEHLVGQILQTRHEPEAAQGAQAEEVLGEAVGVGGVLADRQDGVSVENAAEHVAGLTRCTGDHLRGVGAVLMLRLSRQYGAH